MYNSSNLYNHQSNKKSFSLQSLDSCSSQRWSKFTFSYSKIYSKRLIASYLPFCILPFSKVSLPHLTRQTRPFFCHGPASNQYNLPPVGAFAASLACRLFLNFWVAVKFCNRQLGAAKRCHGIWGPKSPKSMGSFDCYN